MKILLVLIITIAGLSLELQATVWRVNNNPGVDADYTTLSAAIAGASTGDTLYIEASPATYGGGTIDKKLIIIGPGYLLNNNDSTQAHKQTAKVTDIIVSSGADGTVISGMELYDGVNAHTIDIWANEVIIKRCCKLGGSQGGVYVRPSLYGIIIKQNFFYSITGGVNPVYVQSYSSVVVENNYLRHTVWHSLYISPLAGPCVVRNNILVGGVGIEIHNSIVRNNILISGNAVLVKCSEDYNMGNSTQFSGPNSIQNASMSNVFVNNGGTEDNDYKLKPGSPALSAGINGDTPTDMGMFGGPSPYVLSGIPDIPAIFYIDAPASASDNVPLDIHIKSKARN